MSAAGVVMRTLTDEQYAVCRLLAEGQSQKEAARLLYISVSTVCVRLGSARKAVGAHTTGELLYVLGVRDGAALREGTP